MKALSVIDLCCIYLLELVGRFFISFFAFLSNEMEEKIFLSF